MDSSPPTKRRRKTKSEGTNENDKSSTSPVVVFAHGAGAPSSSDWMLRWKDMLKNALNAVEVVTFDYPYIAGGKKKAPPKAEKLVEFHKDIVKKTTDKYPGHPLILAGKSMGSRVSCMVAAEVDIDVSAVICLGYPLKAMNGAVRDETLLQLTIPVMFVQGSKDGLCPLEKLEAVCKKMKIHNELYVINGGDHSFKIGKKHLQIEGSTQDQAEDLAVEGVSSFVSRCLKGK
ncbi:KAT8 REGULATORY NSL COMPLEX SUBUNIT 3/TESTIS-EXPRESSED SEQUENCE 30 PROTEIN-RELATED [Salix koriyanagi]|uniref:KAT8 REGULATORY NSL COMPLEX SUBUNIT 3/TESTIS-EXPRESSED SEQUENCE 30 PROTEIN-RELATED n=1 Tax=Salix koriyanagi TaxID=2511006 RepID=A0A9Q0Q8M0_9ROSI|nr:KAT8 REGULATORY NSL COMPLEX SUBUNIT 3/TESTIS-EXPRESSED SEQUENCE 30 PROTEIN-RELATED [Salix koriyanagi]